MVPDTVPTDIQLLGEPDLHTAQILATLLDQQITTGHLDVRMELSRLGCATSAVCERWCVLDAVDGQPMLLRPSPLLVRVAELCGGGAELGSRPAAR